MDLPHFADGDTGVVQEVILGLDRIWITWLLRPNHFFFRGSVVFVFYPGIKKQKSFEAKMCSP